MLAQAEAPLENGKTSPPTPPGLEGKAVRKDTGKDNVGDRPVKGGGREPPQMVVTVFTWVRISLGFSVSSRKAASGHVQPSVQVRFFVTQDVGPRG